MAKNRGHQISRDGNVTDYNYEMRIILTLTRCLGQLLFRLEEDDKINENRNDSIVIPYDVWYTTETQGICCFVRLIEGRTDGRQEGKEDENTDEKFDDKKIRRTKRRKKKRREEGLKEERMEGVKMYESRTNTRTNRTNKTKRERKEDEKCNEWKDLLKEGWKENRK